MQLRLRLGCADADIDTIAEHERIALCDRGIRADGCGVGDTTLAIRRTADEGVVVFYCVGHSGLGAEKCVAGAADIVTSGRRTEERVSRTIRILGASEVTKKGILITVLIVTACAPAKERVAIAARICSAGAGTLWSKMSKRLKLV